VNVPNGKAGDNPITDVVVWGKDVFGPRTDSLIREIDQFTDDYGIYDPFEPVNEVLWAAEYDRMREPDLYAALLALRERFAARAIRRIVARSARRPCRDAVASVPCA
jgi:hypothetical protein